MLALHCSLLAFSSPIVAPPLPQLACSRLRAPLCGPFAAPPAAPSAPRVTIFSLETCDPCKVTPNAGAAKSHCCWSRCGHHTARTAAALSLPPPPPPAGRKTALRDAGVGVHRDLRHAPSRAARRCAAAGASRRHVDAAGTRRCLTPPPLPCSALSSTRERVCSQIFFGDHHVGGGSDLAALIMANEHLALYEAAAPFQTPPPPSLSLSLSFHARISVLGGRAVHRPTEAACSP